MKKLKRLFILIALISILGMTNFVYASSFNFTTNASSTTLKPGDTVVIGLNISNIDAGESGINTIEAVLEYDENVFEPVLSTNFAGLNNWSITYNDEEGENKGKFVAVIVQEGITEDQAIGNLTLKVKSDVNVDSTNVTFSNIKSNDGVEEITSPNQVISLNIDRPVVEEPEEPITNTVNENTIDEEENLSPNDIPQTGENTYIIIGIVLAAIVVGIIAYAGYKKIKDIK